MQAQGSVDRSDHTRDSRSVVVMKNVGLSANGLVRLISSYVQDTLYCSVAEEIVEAIEGWPSRFCAKALVTVSSVPPQGNRSGPRGVRSIR
jgi:hypothetical protein